MVVKKIMIFGVMLGGSWHHHLMSSVELGVQSKSYIVGRVLVPSGLAIEQQKKAQRYRTISRHATTAMITVCAVAALYGALLLHNNLKQNGNKHYPFTVKNAIDATDSVSGGVISQIAKKILKSASRCFFDFSKFLADSTIMLTAGVVTSAMYGYVSNTMSALHQKETLTWFLEQQTKIWIILADLKERTAEYDVHGALLDSEIFNQDARTHLKAFVSDIFGVVAEYKNGPNVESRDYFSCLLSEIQKKYMRQSDQLEHMQQYLVPLVAHRQRAIKNSTPANLFDRDEQCRADIAQLCNLLVHEMEKLLAFIAIHRHAQTDRVADLIATCNRFLDEIDTMLQLPLDQVAEKSKQNCGMFTVTYEYERFLQQQIDFLDKYCKMVIA